MCEVTKRIALEMNNFICEVTKMIALEMRTCDYVIDVNGPSIIQLHDGSGLKNYGLYLHFGLIYNQGPIQSGPYPKF